MLRFTLFSLLTFTGMSPYLAAQNDTSAEKTSLLPGFFLPNTVGGSAKKPLIENPDVFAIFPTNQGRILFTSHGAYFSTITTPSGYQNHPELHDIGSNAQSTQIVFQTGISKEHATKRQLRPRLEAPMEGSINMLIGPRSNWQPGLKGYKRLIFEDVWDGIDLVYLNDLAKLQFQLEIDPAGNSQDISLKTGTEKLQKQAWGDLEATIESAVATYARPQAFQKINGDIFEVPVSFQIKDQGEFGFLLGDYDPNHKVTIHSAILWSTYVGGAGGFEEETVGGIALDDTGNAYIAGMTSSGDFPLAPGAFSNLHQGLRDVFVAKINPDSTALIFATFIGGKGSDFGNDISLDSRNQPIIVGMTSSNDFPVTPLAFQTVFRGRHDGFITKLSQDGRELVFSTYFGGTEFDAINAVEINSSDGIHVIGQTSGFLPITPNAYDPSFNQNRDTFYAAFTADGSQLSASTFLGGSSFDRGQDLALDQHGFVYLTGYTRSNNFPVPNGVNHSQQSSSVESDAAFVCKMDIAGTSLVYTHLIDGDATDQSYAIAVNSKGQTFVTGHTESEDFPNTPGALNPGGGNPGGVFVSKIASDGQSLIYSARFAGSATDSGRDIYVDAADQAMIAGWTRSSQFPLTFGGYQTSLAGLNDCFLVQLNAEGSALKRSTFFGGGKEEEAIALDISPSGDFVMAGTTESDDLPTTPGAIQTGRNGGNDIFVATFSPDLNNLLASTLLGGTGEEILTEITTDADSNVYVAGVSRQGSFPTDPGAVQGVNAGGSSDVIVAKLNNTGSKYIYATFLGGSHYDIARGLAVDAAGCVFILGETGSEDFPTTPQGFSREHGGLSDVFVTKLNPNGSALVYSTYVGSHSFDYAASIALDNQGNAVAVGRTQSSSFPTTPHVFQRSLSGLQDGYIFKLSPSGDQLIFSTFLGGSTVDSITSVKVDTSNNIYVAGLTFSSTFPTTENAFSQNFSGNEDSFISKVNPLGRSLLYSSYFGGSEIDNVSGMDIDDFGNVYIGGWSNSTDLPITPGAFQESPTFSFLAKLSTDSPLLHYATYTGRELRSSNIYDIAVNSRQEAFIVGKSTEEYSSTFCAPFSTFPEISSGFVTQFNREGTGMLFSTRIGGDYKEIIHAISLDEHDHIFMAGESFSADLPTTNGVISEHPLGWGSGFVMKISPLYDIYITPSGQPLGLSPPEFSVQNDCGSFNTTYHWRTYPTTNFTNGFQTMMIDPAPSVTTRIDATVGNENGTTTTRQAVLLVPHHPEFLDFNNDGCNSEPDLWDLAQFWNQPFPMDADGNQFIDIRDLLFVNLSGHCP